MQRSQPSSRMRRRRSTRRHFFFLSFPPCVTRDSKVPGLVVHAACKQGLDEKACRGVDAHARMCPDPPPCWHVHCSTQNPHRKQPLHQNPAIASTTTTTTTPRHYTNSPPPPLRACACTHATTRHTAHILVHILVYILVYIRIIIIILE